MELSRWHLGINSFWHQLGSSLGLEIPGDSFLGIPLCFRCHLGITSFWRQLRSLLELSRWHLGIISFKRQLGYSLGLGITGDSFSLIPICFPPVWVYYDYPFVGNYIFPRLGFTMILLSWGTTYIFHFALFMQQDNFHISSLHYLSKKMNPST